MKKYTCCLIGLLLLSAACEDVYKADLDKVENLVVIEALLTTDTSVNYVKVMKTRNFYSEESQEAVSGAGVTITDDAGNIYSLSESSVGYFQPGFAASPGTSYKIKVEAEGETYESDYELMPPLPSLDSLYAFPDTLVTYTYASDGQPMVNLQSGMTVYADLPQTADLKNYRFRMPRTMEYIVPPQEGFPSPPPVYGWKNYNQSGVFPIDGPAEYGHEAQLTKRKLIFLSNEIEDLISQEQVDSSAYMVGWLVDLSMFGLSEQTFSFYESVNAQLEADGKLFDPVYSQLVPNFSCTSDPGKEAVGYFEVSSYQYRRFYVMAPRSGKNAYTHFVDEPGPIPASGQLKSDTPPSFWQDRYSN